MNMKILTRYLIFDRLEVACINNRSAQPAAIRSSPSPRPVYKLQSSDPPPPVSRRHFVSDTEDAQQYASTGTADNKYWCQPACRHVPVSPVYGDVSC